MVHFWLEIFRKGFCVYAPCSCQKKKCKKTYAKNRDANFHKPMETSTNKNKPKEISESWVR